MVQDGCAIAAWFRLGVYGNMHMVQAGCAREHGAGFKLVCRLSVHGSMVWAGCAWLHGAGWGCMATWDRLDVGWVCQGAWCRLGVPGSMAQAGCAWLQGGGWACMVAWWRLDVHGILHGFSQNKKEFKTKDSLPKRIYLPQVIPPSPPSPLSFRAFGKMGRHICLSRVQQWLALQKW